jgi:hypothetical protein
MKYNFTFSEKALKLETVSDYLFFMGKKYKPKTKENIKILNN